MAFELPERFWLKVNKDADSGCWEWLGSKNHNGYGRCYFQSNQYRVHRLAYMSTQGEIPEGMHIDHLCHNRACVRPAHLRLATRFVNNQNRAGAQSNNTSGFRGVNWHKTRQKWRAQVNLDGKNYYLGLYVDPKEAGAVVQEWRRANMRNSLMDH